MYNFAYYDFNKCNVLLFNRVTYCIHRIKHPADMQERAMALYVYLVFGLGTPTVFWVKIAWDIYCRVWSWRHGQAVVLGCTIVVGRVRPLDPILYVIWLSNILYLYIRVILLLITLLNVGLVLALYDFCGMRDSFIFLFFVIVPWHVFPLRTRKFRYKVTWSLYSHDHWILGWTSHTWL